MIIGITGSSGSGKTTISSILSERNDIYTINADEVARKLSVKGTDYLNSIVNCFGEKALLENGNLNRTYLAEEIYNNDISREKLNRLTFKYVVDEILKKIKEVKEKKFIIIDAPLLFEAGLENFCDYTISLISDFETKIKRICLRDKISKETAIKRLKIQHDDNYYIEKSDFIINNTKDCDLKLEIEKIFEKIEG